MGNNYHFVGIGGIGMSALARLLLQQNERVSGSDLTIKQELVDEGAIIFQGHHKKHIQKNMTVIFSTAVSADNPEIVQAKELGCPILHRADLLRLLTEKQSTLAVAGTHGKTTVSALLAWVLESAGYDPSYALGGLLQGKGSNGKYGKGNYFVIEADESDGSFVKYCPEAAIITNLEAEHMDYYKSEENLYSHMRQFVNQIKQPNAIQWCYDDPNLRTLSLPGASYGFEKGADLHITNFQQRGWQAYFDVAYKDHQYSHIALNMIGKHNVLNAAAVLGLCLDLGLSIKAIQQGLQTFSGIKRRQDRLGEHHKVLFIDDYAHHPTEIKVTLQALRQAVQERKICVILQPHRYTRVKHFLELYAKAFDAVDEIWITDIFAAGETPIEGIDANVLINEIETRTALPCRYVATQEIIHEIGKTARPHDVIVFLGAGSITQIAQKACQVFAQSKPQKWKLGVIAGGRSDEHEVSITSSRFFLKNLDENIYQLKTAGITRDGKWKVSPNLFNDIEMLHGSELNKSVLDHLQSCEVLLPIMHGPLGEDGMIQGFLETLQIPYVGSDYRSASISMNKSCTKRIWQAKGLQVAPFIDFSEQEFRESRDCLIDQMEAEINYPAFVKPLHYGSSIGVSEVNNRSDLIKAIEFAIGVDSYVMVEKKIVGRELEVGIIGDDFIHVAHPGEVDVTNRFYDYAAKYGLDPITKITKADLTDVECMQIKEIVKMAYKSLMCSGMARIDLFLQQDGQIFLNEINPLPGCSPTSLFPRVWSNENMPSSELIDKLVISALYRHRKNQRKILQGQKLVKSLIMQHAQKR